MGVVDIAFILGAALTSAMLSEGNQRLDLSFLTSVSHWIGPSGLLASDLPNTRLQKSQIAVGQKYKAM